MGNRFALEIAVRAGSPSAISRQLFNGYLCIYIYRYMLRILILTSILCAGVSLTNAQCLSGNCENGNGTYKWESGDLYVGDWVEGKRTGYGRYDWVDGSYYVGRFLNNLLEGKGAYYASDGSSMIGTFEQNSFIQEPTDTNPDSSATHSEDVGKEDIFLQMSKQLELDSIAKAAAIKAAIQSDLCTVVQRAVADFPNNFKTYQGPEQQNLLSMSAGWYSLLMVKDTKEAGINGGFLSGNNSFYNILFAGKEFEAAKEKYDSYVNIIKECATGCCSMVYDPYEYKSDSYTSYSTSWLTFMVKDGYDGTIYSDLVIEVELMSEIISEGWSIYLRVYHLSDLDN